MPSNAEPKPPQSRQVAVELEGFGLRLRVAYAAAPMQSTTRTRLVIGKEVRGWRERNGYRQADLVKELGIGSRGTLSALENSEKVIPRQMELALVASRRTRNYASITGARTCLTGRRKRASR